MNVCGTMHSTVVVATSEGLPKMGELVGGSVLAWDRRGRCWAVVDIANLAGNRDRYPAWAALPPSYEDSAGGG